MIEQFKSLKLSKQFMQNLEATDKKGSIILESLELDTILKNYNARCAMLQKQQGVPQSKSDSSAKKENASPKSNGVFMSQYTPTAEEHKTEIQQSIQRGSLRLDDFIPIKYINSGGYGTVVLVKFKNSNQKEGKQYMAMKIIKKEDMIRKNSVARTKAEVALYKYFEKPHSKIQDMFNATFKDIVVRFYGSFKTKTHLCMVLEYCQYGDLRGLLEISFAFGERWSR